jgi:hypothetical protein
LRVGKREELRVGKGGRVVGWKRGRGMGRVEGGKRGMGRVKGVKRGMVKCGKIRVRKGEWVKGEGRVKDGERERKRVKKGVGNS